MMKYKLKCLDRCYPTQYFTSKKEVRNWLHNHSRIQLSIQSDTRDSKNIGHDIDLRQDTYVLADYFDFDLIKLNTIKL